MMILGLLLVWFALSAAFALAFGAFISVGRGPARTALDDAPLRAGSTDMSSVESPAQDGQPEEQSSPARPYVEQHSSLLAA